MACCRYILYLATDERGHWLEISPAPGLDLAHYIAIGRQAEITELSPPLPLGVAHYLKSKVQRAGLTAGKVNELLATIPFLNFDDGGQRATQKQALVRGELERLGYQDLGGPDPFKNNLPDLERLPGENDLIEVNLALTGRLLFEDEVERALLEQGRFLEMPLEKILQILYLRGELERYPGVGFTRPGELYCHRCGEGKNIFPGECSATPAPCYYCEECILMGASKLCRPLYGKPRAAFTGLHGADRARTKKTRVRLDFELTPAQRDAADTLAGFVGEQPSRELLVWAVCGAGKTEVAFDAIAAALDAKTKVLYAVPRRDVVLELFPRFKKAFPGISISVLYGGSRTGRYDDTQLTLATTHQVIRFYRNFDLVVLDEVDAFPYRGSRMLYGAVERARIPGGKIIYLTATPRREYLQGVRKGEITLVTIPARHHGHPLPVPRIVKTRPLQKQEGRHRIPDIIRDFLHQSIEGDKAQVFVFVPAVALVQKVAEALQEEVRLPPFSNWHGDWVKGSHARDPNRDEKREAFARGDFPIFVTTSIMERGITVPNANVLVLFADYEKIYDTGTLVQMSGRSGRTLDHPVGRVLFVGARTTPSMEEAVEQIKYMNKEAESKGYLSAVEREMPR